MKIEDKLRSDLRNFMIEWGIKPDKILMHPKILDDLREEVFSSLSASMNRHDPVNRYMGMRILQSIDLKENEFEFLIKKQP